MHKYVPFLGRVKISHCCRKHDKKDATKRKGFIAPHYMKRTVNYIIVMGFPGLIHRQGFTS